MKTITIRVEDYIYNRLNLVTNENRTSMNKVICSILKKVIDQPKEINYLEEINNSLTLLLEKTKTISKRQTKHLEVSMQHFANQGYLSNASIKEDRCLKEITNKKDGFND